MIGITTLTQSFNKEKSMNLNKISFMSQARFEETGDTVDEDICLVGGVAVAGDKYDVIPMTLNVQATYTAPSDGYVSLYGIMGTAGSNWIYNSTTEIGLHRDGQTGTYRINMRVAKGDVILLMQTTGTIYSGRFYRDK